MLTEKNYMVIKMDMVMVEKCMVTFK